jgi:uncharacterized SAM-binding protein YcdF (DUF218 family)
MGRRAAVATEVAAPRRANSFVRRLHLSAALLLLAGLIALLAGFAAYVGRIQAIPPASPGRADGIVVLTGGADRIAAAAALLQAGSGRRLLISGIDERTTPDEVVRQAPAMREFVSCCVDFGYRARSTIGNALESRAWSDMNRYSTIVLVTSKYHMPRALAEFANAMPDRRILPYVVESERVDLDHWWERPGTIRLLLTEYLKFVAGSLRMRLESTPGALAPDTRAAVRHPAARRPESRS